jgi:hypothetical protein
VIIGIGATLVGVGVSVGIGKKVGIWVAFVAVEVNVWVPVAVAIAGGIFVGGLDVEVSVGEPGVLPGSIGVTINVDTTAIVVGVGKGLENGLRISPSKNPTPNPAKMIPNTHVLFPGLTVTFSIFMMLKPVRIRKTPNNSKNTPTKPNGEVTGICGILPSPFKRGLMKMSHLFIKGTL